MLIFVSSWLYVLLMLWWISWQTGAVELMNDWPIIQQTDWLAASFIHPTSKKCSKYHFFGSYCITVPVFPLICLFSNPVSVFFSIILIKILSIHPSFHHSIHQAICPFIYTFYLSSMFTVFWYIFICMLCGKSQMKPGVHYKNLTV